MTTERIIPAGIEAQTPVVMASPHRARRTFRSSLFPMPLAALAALAIDLWVPDRQISATMHLYPRLLGAVIVIGFCLAIIEWLRPPVRPAGLAGSIWSAIAGWLRKNAPLIAAAFLVCAFWELATLKQIFAPLGMPLPLPYFPGPDLVLQSLHDDWRLMLDCTWHSLLLLFSGYAAGAALGVASGVLIGWSSRVRYWGMPVLKLIGPIPATAFIPLALMLFPSAFVSAVALIALTVWFPVTMLTASGVANVPASLLDVARTLGARRAYLIFRVAIPAAMPNIFVGLFMGLGTSFLTLIVAETVGVSSGLGWYINWAKAWADYPKVYAALVIMAVFFSSIMTLLFKVRDRVLVYQKGTIKW